MYEVTMELLKLAGMGLGAVVLVVGAVCFGEVW